MTYPRSFQFPVLRLRRKLQRGRAFGQHDHKWCWDCKQDANVIYVLAKLRSQQARMGLCCKLYGSFTHSERISFKMSIVPEEKADNIEKNIPYPLRKCTIKPTQQVSYFWNREEKFILYENQMKPRRLLKHQSTNPLTFKILIYSFYFIHKVILVFDITYEIIPSALCLPIHLKRIHIIKSCIYGKM